MDDRPYLDCSECGEPLFPADGWVDGDWVWREEGPIQCPCGAWCIVDIDDDCARVSEVEGPARGALLAGVIANGGTLPTVGPVPSVADIIAERWDEDEEPEP